MNLIRHNRYLLTLSSMESEEKAGNPGSREAALLTRRARSAPEEAK
ncbi:MAG: hypothetical protein RNU03_13345 [Candidatus Sedimenticola sp. (ex Thyasira tokunagai)]